MSDQSASRYPLEWPLGWKRTVPHRRIRSGFRTKSTVGGALSIFQATERLERQVTMMGGQNAVLSTNVSLRLDGRPRSDENPTDPGCAIYFRFKQRATVFACDKYDRVADNIAAVAAHIDALRRIERYGVGTLEQALAGYRSLPADTAADWRLVFGFKPDERVSADALKDRYRARAMDAHPDRGGNEEAMMHINRARDYALSEIGGA